MSGDLLDLFSDIPPPEEDAPVPQKTPRVWSVTDITHAIREQLEGKFLNIWVCGEVTDFRNPNLSHWYFSLKDADNKLSAVMYNREKSKIKFKVEQGMELVCYGKVSFWPKGGVCQFVIEDCEPKGVGALQLAFEQLKQKLLAEGLFDKSRKKPIPFLPRRVGVVTSPTGAAIRDICNVLRRRFPSIDIVLVPARVQGEGAAADVARAIAFLDTQDVDVMIVGRGGGSIEDLWAFNEEIVARAIFAAAAPVVSAVGHEIDYTIADFVADLRAATPSAAAELVVPVQAELLQSVWERRRRLANGLRAMVSRSTERLHHLRQRLRFPQNRITDGYQWVDNLRERLQRAMQHGIEHRHQQVAHWAAQLQHLSPLAVLAKGYAVVQKKGLVVRDAATLKTGDIIDVRVEKGSLEAKVI